MSGSSNKVRAPTCNVNAGYASEDDVLAWTGSEAVKMMDMMLCMAWLIPAAGRFAYRHFSSNNEVCREFLTARQSCTASLDTCKRCLVGQSA